MGADVLCVPSYWPGYVFAATLAARSCGVKVVIMAESHYATGRNDGFMVLIKRILVRQYASAMVGGSAQRSFFRYLGMPESHIFDGYDVVNNEYFAIQADVARKNDAALRKQLRLPKRFILSLGRFVTKKNLPILIRAYESASRHGKIEGVHLVFVGSGYQKEDLVLLTAQLGLPVYDLEDNAGEESIAEQPYGVHFHPFAQIEQTPIYYALAECFVLPSRSEEWGLVVNEAMACACPVVVSRLVGCSFDLVEQGVTGFRFSPDNADELAWYLEAICEKSVLREAMSVAARRHVFEWGPARFGRNMILSALATKFPKLVRASTDDNEGLIVLLQTSFPDYRVPVYDGLSRELGARFRLYTGMEYFTPDVRTCSEFRSWIVVVKNLFLLDRKFLWQGDALTEVLAADIAILELNPRILSNWLILFTRGIWDRPTILWGHAWGREGDRSYRNLLRLLMMRAASAVITYTKGQKEQLARILPDMPIVAAPNSSVCRSDVMADVPNSLDALDTVIYVGRLNPTKKPGLLLEAFIKALPQMPRHVRLCFVGSGDELPKLTARTQQAGLNGRVIFKGHVNDRQILRSLYARAFTSVSPGYVGLSAIQSFSFGVPMVIADKENHAPEIEACVASENSVFFTANDSDALAKTLVGMWEDRMTWCARRGKIAHCTAQNYSTDTMVAAFVKTVRGLSSHETY
jgi:glycosyltransferase involved in cell wall biosynthesis